MIDVTLLGTAALMPLPERALTAVYLTCGGHSILFDCGEGTQTAARRAGVNLMKTDLIALTHYHGDHIFGLPGLLQTMFSMGRTQPLYITGPRGLEEVLSPILKLAGWLSFPVLPLTRSSGVLRLTGLARGWPERAVLTAFPTQHRVPSRGYVFTLGRAGKFLPEKARALEIPVQYWRTLQSGQRVTLGERTILPEQVLGEEREGLRVVFTGDTKTCPAVEYAARGADLLISEATYGDMEQSDLAWQRGHMTFAQAAEIAAWSGAKRLWLTHYSQMIEDPEQYLPQAREQFPDAVCGRDGMRLTLRFAPQTPEQA